MDHSPLGVRMKDLEHAHRHTLPGRTHTVIRLDGRAFHTYTANLERPYDAAFAADMDAVAAAVAAEVSGCELAYVQSDEISLLVTDFAKPGTQPWFGGVTQKIVSVTAALASVVLNERRPGTGRPLFDSRVHTLPTRADVAAYFVWRQRDCMRNSVSMAGQAHYSPKRLHGLNTSQVRDLLAADGHPWEDLDEGFRMGRVVRRQVRTEEVTFEHKRTKQTQTVQAQRTYWVPEPAPLFGFDEAQHPLLEVPTAPTQPARAAS